MLPLNVQLLLYSHVTHYKYCKYDKRGFVIKQSESTVLFLRSCFKVRKLAPIKLMSLDVGGVFFCLFLYLYLSQENFGSLVET